MTPLEREQKRMQVFGYAALLTWATLGALLEGAHAFKLSSYLDQPLRRELMVWGHAHGVGLALVLLAHAANLRRVEASARSGSYLRAAAVLMPLGFVLGTVGHSESDPGPLIWLLPLGALFLLAGLAGALRAQLRD